ncbi:MAG: phage virion morphogenesis protein [Gammaproteobacteria bacterium]|nr:phage virion morphogenesis protein [Gammaproteobacteria bacterium]
MSSVALRFDLSSVARLQERLTQLGNINRGELLDAIGAEVETQTHRRIRDEKTAPDGTPWEPWSKNYGRGRHGGHSLLMGEGDLDDSIQYLVNGDEVETGSNIEDYAAIHQFGGTSDMAPGPASIPAREYLGLSDENIDDIAAIVDDFVDEHIARVIQ